MNVENSEFSLDYSQKLMFVGSCFSAVVGDYLRSLKFDALVNPFGTLFNPASIFQLLTRALDNRQFDESDLFLQQNVFASFWLHGDFNNVSKEEYLKSANASLEAAREYLLHGEWLFLTFGTANTYRLKSTGRVVSNCHKQDASSFEQRLLAVTEIVEMAREFFGRLQKANNRLKVVFTVSPIRHLKMGLHQNNVSKSILLLAVDEICRSLPDTIYFESYELLLDDLRDYRFYDDDLVHPSSEAKKYIFEKFIDAFYLNGGNSPLRQQKLKLAEKILARRSHLPRNPESEEYALFVKKTAEMEREFERISD